MGLDIYVRWGVQFNEEGECLDFPDEARVAQFSGFIDKPEAGYMRYNWAAVGGIRKLAPALEAPSPIWGLFPGWTGSNGEELAIDAAEIERLLRLRDDMLSWGRQDQRLSEATAIVAAIVPDEEPKEALRWFFGKIAGTMTMIDFIRQNADKPGLRIEFD